jgi:uncharacterized protein YegP (UPF0339 family)
MYYMMYRDTAGQWRWNLRSANHEIIASGESYRHKADCEHAIALVKGSYGAPVYER